MRRLKILNNMLIKMQRHLVLDYETRSECDLKKCGPWEYSMHPSTQILCVSWQVVLIGDAEPKRGVIKAWSPFLPRMFDDPKDLRTKLEDERYILGAHNAQFEQFITLNVLKKYKAFQ